MTACASDGSEKHAAGENSGSCARAISGGGDDDGGGGGGDDDYDDDDDDDDASGDDNDDDNDDDASTPRLQPWVHSVWLLSFNCSAHFKRSSCRVE